MCGYILYMEKTICIVRGRHECVETYADTHAHAYIHTCICIYTHVCTYIYMHIHILIYIYAHTHTCICLSSLSSSHRHVNFQYLITFILTYLLKFTSLSVSAVMDM